MKVRVGVQAFKYDTKANPSFRQVEDAITRSIVDGIIDREIEVAPKQLRAIENRVRIAATSEANRVFEVITNFIDQPRTRTTSLVGGDLMRGGRAPSDSALAGKISGSVPWEGLSLDYMVHKSKKYPSNKYRMFRYSNGLRSYFARQGPTIIRNRLGGVVVDVTGAGANQRRRRGVGTPSESTKITIGRVSVTMFPKLNPALAPMLATRRWTDVNQSGAMERQIFGDLATRRKLVNKTNPYRPLVAPTVQFFMLIRIPGRIQASLNDHFRRVGIKEF